MPDTTFSIEIGNGPEQSLVVKTGVYIDAVAAIPAILGIGMPFTVKIWSPDLLPEYGPYYYRVERNSFGTIEVIHDLSAYPRSNGQSA
jgi:hypothetical protein